MGWVYRAFDTNLTRFVALKIPKFRRDRHPELIERFLREAKAAASLRHPNICRVYDAGEVDDRCYISMELVEGESLASRLKRQPPSLEQAVTWTRKLARALAAAHERGIIHRDMKPSNVMIDESDEPLIMDFGLARLVGVEEPTCGTANPPGEPCPERSSEDRAGRTGLPATSPGAILGTLEYMSLQQAEGRPIDGRSDIFSLGLILYEMLTGKSPLPQRKTLAETQRVLREIEPDRSSLVKLGIDRELETVCLKSLAKQPEERFASASDFAEALEQYLERRKQRAARWLRTALVASVAVVVASVFVLLGLGIYCKTGKGPVTVIIDEPDVQGPLTVIPDESNVRVTVAGSRVGIEELRQGHLVDVGEHEIVVVKQGFETHCERFVIRWRGSKAEVSVKLKPLEPVRLASASYLGGNGDDQVFGLDTDGSGSWALVGNTASTNLTARGKEDSCNNAVLVARLDPHWNKHMAYLGGGNYEAGAAVAMDRDGTVYVTGWTMSVPLEASLGRATEGNVGREAFVAKYNASNKLLWTKLLGGNDEDLGTAIALDSDKNVIVVGTTRSRDFMVDPPDGGKPPGNDDVEDVDCFIVKLTPDGEIVWWTRFGGGGEERPTGVAVGPGGVIRVCGDTFSRDFSASTNAYFGGDRDAFLARIDAGTGTILSSRYLGGKKHDAATSLSIDRQGNVVVAGWTASPDFFEKESVVGQRLTIRRRESQESHDVFVAMYTARLEPKWSFVLGGSEDDEARGVAFDASGNVLFGGETRSVDFPTAGDFSRRLKGTCDGFVAKLSPDGQLRYATLVGGSGIDVIHAVCAGPAGESCVAGWTDSVDLPGTKARGSSHWGGGFDGWFGRVEATNQRSPNWEPRSSLAGLREAKVAWEHEFNRDRGTLIPCVKLTPDRQHLAVFHYTNSPIAGVTKVDLRNKSSQELNYRIQDHFVTMSGWIDDEGNFLFTAGRWGDHSLWKFKSDSKTLVWAVPDSGRGQSVFRFLCNLGFEYVQNVIADRRGDIYAAGYIGSFVGKGSGCMKWSKDGKPLWPWPEPDDRLGPGEPSFKPPQWVRHGTGNDSYAAALALHANRLYRVGQDYYFGLPKDRFHNAGRLVVHDAESGQVMFEVVLEDCERLKVVPGHDPDVTPLDVKLDATFRRPSADPRSLGGSLFGGVLVQDDGCIWIACTVDLYWSDNTPSQREHTLLLELDSKGRLLQQHDFPGADTYIGRNALRAGPNQSFYIAYQQRHEGALYPAVAEFSLDGKRSWRRTILKRGWDVFQGGIDAEGGTIYVPLADLANPEEKTCVIAIESEKLE